MAMIHGRVYRLVPENDWLFRTIFPDLDPEAKFILISPEGMLTFKEKPAEEPGSFAIPHINILSYYDLAFESE